MTESDVCDICNAPGRGETQVCVVESPGSVLTTNPTLEGDGTALFITNLLESNSVKITRLARGVASGSVLEFANREMQTDAWRGR